MEKITVKMIVKNSAGENRNREIKVTPLELESFKKRIGIETKGYTIEAIYET